VEHKTEWRRDKVQELCSKGYSVREISHILQLGLAAVNREILYLRNRAKDLVRMQKLTFTIYESDEQGNTSSKV
jgi:predicted transcriptional regulator